MDVPTSKPISRRRAFSGTLISATVAVAPRASVVRGCESAGMLTPFLRGVEWFHQNIFRQLGTDAQARVANLADHINLAADEAYLLLFTKAHLPQAFGDLRGRGELLDADSRAGNNPAQRAEIRVLLAPVFDGTC